MTGSKTMTLTRRTALAAAGTLAMPGILRAQSSTPIRIGEINSYTGQPAFTLPYRNGWQLALEQANAAGGVLGRKLEIISRDDAGRPQDAVRVAGRAAVATQKVDLLAGTFLSNVGLAVSDLALQNKRLFIGGEPLSDALVWEHGNRYTFRLRPSTYMQAAMLVEDAAKLPAKRWVTVAPNYEYGQSAVKWFKQLLQAKRPDVEFVGEQWPALGTHRRRRHRAGAGPAPPGRGLQRHLRRRPDQLRPPGQHPRPVREPLRRLHADRRARVPGPAGRRDAGGLDRHRLPLGHAWTPRSTGASPAPIARSSPRRRSAAPSWASRW